MESAQPYSISRRIGYILSLVALALLFAWAAATRSFGAPDKLASDQGSFESSAAVSARSNGSPVGPPTKVVLCHKGHTLNVNENAVAPHLAHGDTLGPCPSDH